MARRRRPDILVAVDVGYYTTTVAWMPIGPNNTGSMNDMRPIVNWPGAPTPSTQYVPTAFAYDSDNNAPSWGFGLNVPGPSDVTFAHTDFDPVLNPDRAEHITNTRQSTQQAQFRLGHFLSQVYQHLRLEIGSQCPWNDSVIEFFFTKPRGNPTWLRRAVKDAGFGSDSPKHNTTMISSLRWEAELHSLTAVSPILPGMDDMKCIVVDCEPNRTVISLHLGQRLGIVHSMTLEEGTNYMVEQILDNLRSDLEIHLGCVQEGYIERWRRSSYFLRMLETFGDQPEKLILLGDILVIKGNDCTAKTDVSSSFPSWWREMFLEAELSRVLRYLHNFVKTIPSRYSNAAMGELQYIAIVGHLSHFPSIIDCLNKRLKERMDDMISSNGSPLPWLPLHGFVANTNPQLAAVTGLLSKRLQTLKPRTNITQPSVDKMRLDVVALDDETLRHTYLREENGIRVRVQDVWQRQKALGQGGFGSVWLDGCVSGPRAGELQAVKEINLFPETGKAIDFNRELEALAMFSGEKYQDCFVTSYGWWITGDSLYIAIEYFELGDLEGFLNSPLSEDVAGDIAYQLAEGLCYMHEIGFAHRDLKPGNILVVQNTDTSDAELDHQWWVKISDFGLSKYAQVGVTELRTRIGTLHYMAPEVLGILTVDELKLSKKNELESYTTAVDIWSLGAIIFRMVTGQYPFPDRVDLGRYVTLGAPFPAEPLIRAGASEECIQFVIATMAAEARLRPQARALFEDPLTFLRESPFSDGQDEQHHSRHRISPQSVGQYGLPTPTLQHLT
ncbi:kinase-like domain-containing protein [Cercophora newfieldiana]|uniref:non-specific serine/threonine protein kinase n=1 Tax=Cercophora newfieldiana TaxID=92897 RepID=A0AA39YK40_9PEZI|nr:kinase-like domain-containing protein [Cercophora newfieldiana]